MVYACGMIIKQSVSEARSLGGVPELIIITLLSVNNSVLEGFTYFS